jgi:hypothetical protein
LASVTASATDTIVTSYTVSVKADKSTYTANQPVQITAVVSASGMPVAGASVTFTITGPGTNVTIKAPSPTSASGSVGITWTAKSKASGTYQLRAVATPNGISGSDTTSFTVR